MKNFFYCFFVFTLFVNSKLGAQTNIDFESTAVGTYTSANAVSGWTVSSQTVPGCTGTVSWTPGSQEFSIVSTPISNFSIIGAIGNSPLGGTVVAQLNDMTANAYATKLSQSFTVTSSNNALQLAFAGILEDGGHSCCDQTSLKMQIRDASGMIFPCSSFSSAPGNGCSGAVSFSTFGTTAYTNWQAKYIDLSYFINTIVTIEIIVNDCSVGDHYATLLVDGNILASNIPGNDLRLINSAMPVSYCAGANVASICIPSYYYVNWISPQGSPTLSASQATSPCISISNPVANAIYTANLTFPFSANTCTFSQTFALVSSTVAINAIGQYSSCNGGATGSGTLLAGGSGSGYIYNWYSATNSSISTYSIVNSLAPGVYSVAVSAAGSQSSTCGTSVNTITVSSAPITLQSVFKPYCNNEAYLFLPPAITASSYQWYDNTLSAITSSLGGNSSMLTVNSPSTGANYYLTYTDWFGCRDSVQYTLVQASAGSLSLTSSPLVCPGATNGSVSLQLLPASSSPFGPCSFSVSSTGTTSVYSASAAPGSATIFTAFNLSAGGTYSINAFDGVCKYSQTFTVPVNVFDFTLSTSGSTTLCPGLSTQATVNFTSPVTPSQYSYSWSPTNNMFGGTTQNAIITPVAPTGSIITTIYTVVVTSSAANCSVTKTLAITAANLATPTINLVPLLCQNQISYTPLASPGGGTFTGNGTSISNGQIIPANSAVGSNTFSYSISFGTCVNKTSSTYTVNAPPVISISGNTLLCEGQSTSLLASGANTYNWNTSNTASVISVTPFATSVYTATGQSAITTCSDTKTITVTVIPHPTLTILGDTLLCIGESSTLTVSGANSYLWGNGSSSQTIFVSPTVTTIYTVSGTSVLASCSGTEEITVKVSSCNFVGLKELNLSEILSIYPNPTNDKATLDAKEDVSFSLHDALGRQLIEEKTPKKNHTVNLGNYPNGIYLLKIYYKSETKILKVVKSN